MPVSDELLTDELRNELIRAFDERALLRTELQGLKSVAFDLVQEHLAEIRNLERENDRLRTETQRALEEPTQNEHDLYAEVKRLASLIRDVQPWSAVLPEHLSRRLIEALPVREAGSGDENDA
jgi:hypothetical protein